MGKSIWIMWKHERIVVVEYKQKLVCKGRNRKRRIKNIRIEKLVKVIRPYAIDEVGSYPELETGNDKEKQCTKVSCRKVWCD